MDKSKQLDQILKTFTWRSIIALVIVFGTVVFLFALLHTPIPEGNKDALMLATGAFLSITANVAGYYFGSSKDKSDSEKVTNAVKLNETQQKE